MKGSPRSIMLSWANRVAGLWTSAAVSAVKQQQSAAVRKLTKPVSTKARAEAQA